MKSIAVLFLVMFALVGYCVADKQILTLMKGEQSASILLATKSQTEIKFVALRPVCYDQGIPLKFSYGGDCMMHMTWKEDIFRINKISAAKGDLCYVKPYLSVNVALKLNKAESPIQDSDNNRCVEICLVDNKKLDDQPGYLLNFSLISSQGSAKCNVSVQFDDEYVVYVKRVPATVAAVRPKEAIDESTLLWIMLGIVALLLVSIVALGIGIYCCFIRKSNDGASIESQYAAVNPVARNYPMTKSVLSTTDVSWTFKTERKKDEHPPPKELLEEAYQYLKHKGLIKEADTLNQKNRKACEYLKQRQLWNYTYEQEQDSSGIKAEEAESSKQAPQDVEPAQKKTNER